MTTEVVLLLAIFVFVTAGAFFGEKGPFQVFERSAPRLGARLEKQIATGRDFKVSSGALRQWQTEGDAPDGRLR
jgi:hypothetical protein